MADVQGLADALFGGRRLERAATEPSGTHYEVGTVASDSEAGRVRVTLAGDATSAEGGDAAIEVPTTAHGREGQRAIVQVVDGQPRVIGFFGGGDADAEDVAGVSEALDAYKTQASEAFATRRELVESEEGIISRVKRTYATGRQVWTEMKQTAERVLIAAGERATELVAGEATARDAAISVSANGIRQEVSATYETKGNVSALATRVRQTEQDVTTIIEEMGDMTDGYSVMLSGDAVSLVGGTTYANAATATTTVYAYRGAQQVACSVDTSRVTFSGSHGGGITVGKDSDATQPTLTFTVAADKVSGNCYAIIPVIVPEAEITIVKLLSFSVSRTGQNGTNGTPGLNGYIHIAWATSADGSQGFSTTVSTGKTYLGTYTDNVSTGSQDYRTYSWSLIKGAAGEQGSQGLPGATGPQGPKGDRGVDVAAVVPHYLLQASTATPPAKPTTKDPSGWSTTEPAYQEGSTQTLYTCERTDLTDGTYAWSSVSVSSAYEAAKQAYNKAVAAGNVASQLATLVRQYGQGVLVCKTGQTMGALMNADGSFDVVGVAWDDGVPTASGTLATFGAQATSLHGGGFALIADAAMGRYGSIVRTGDMEVSLLHYSSAFPDGPRSRIEIRDGDMRAVRAVADVLFNNPTQSLTGGITLSSSAADYNHMRIYFRTNDDEHSSVDVYNPNNKKVVLSANHFTATTGIAMYAKSKTVLISGTSINTHFGDASVSGEAQIGGTTKRGDYIAIVRVEAWNE